MGAEEVVEATMKALIIYDETALASKAQAMLGRAAHRADEALLWTVKPWRLDLLILPLTADEALKDAAEVHLIVFAVHSQADLSPHLLDWLEKWAGCRQVQDAALAVFDGGNGDTLSTNVAPELSQFAGRQGLSFIFGDPGPSEEGSALLVQSLDARSAASTPTLEHSLEQSEQGYYQHWGINE